MLALCGGGACGYPRLAGLEAATGLNMSGPAKKSVSKGSRCNNTAAIQNAINIMNGGKNNLKVDGIFGDNTESAVKAFQRACGLDDDGKVGNETVNWLFEQRSLTQTLTVEIPKQALAFTGKALRPPAFLDTAGTLLTRRKDIQAWTDAPRLAMTGIEAPKLDLKHIGLQTASMIAHGVKQLPPFQIFSKLPDLNPTLPHSLQFVGSTEDLRHVKVSFYVDKLIQPRTPTTIRPYFKTEFTPGIDTQLKELKVQWKGELGATLFRIQIADVLDAGVNANLWASANAAVGMGGPAGQLSGGLKVDGRAVAHVFKSEFQLGPIKRTSIDFFGGFNFGLSAHGRASPEGLFLNLIPPKFGAELGTMVTIELDGDKKKK